MVGAGLENAATGSGMSEKKRAASMSPPKLRVSSNFDGRRGNRAVGRSGKAQAISPGRTRMSCLRAASDNSGGDVFIKGKEAGGAQDFIFHNPNDDKEEEEDNNKDGEEAELALLHWEMNALEHRSLSAISQAQRAGKTLSVALSRPWRTSSKGMLTPTQVPWKQPWSRTQVPHCHE